MNYWEDRYKKGKDSGRGSAGKYRKWKWNVIRRFVNIKDKTVLDVGCGDIQFIKKKKFESYLGLDISPTIIEQNRKKRADLRFEVADVTLQSERGKFDVVLCMDLLFHIMKEENFKNLLNNLDNWTGEYLFVINWCKNPLPYSNDEYQYFRDLSFYLDWLPNLDLVDTFRLKNDPYNMLYVFRRK
jgi:SAM-dependent methyltransferase